MKKVFDFSFGDYANDISKWIIWFVFAIKCDNSGKQLRRRQKYAAQAANDVDFANAFEITVSSV